MAVNSNWWNKVRYTLYTPIYDSVARHFSASRKQSIDSLNLQPGQNVLIVGAGTGLDLVFMPTDVNITATDITPAMVNRIVKRASGLGMQVDAQIMDGQNLKYDAEPFDVVILHLILAVIPDPIACIQEVERVLKPGGKAAVYDKFRPQNTEISGGRKLLNYFTNFLATDITRDIESIVAKTDLQIVQNEPADFNGNFRRVLLEK